MNEQEKRQQEECRRVFVTIRATEAERNIVHAVANHTGMTVSELTRLAWARMMGLGQDAGSVQPDTEG